eukprot:SAG31_NODE_204_length_20414_cov_19.143392_8_plen_94_part_00
MLSHAVSRNKAEDIWSGTGKLAHQVFPTTTAGSCSAEHVCGRSLSGILGGGAGPTRAASGGGGGGGGGGGRTSNGSWEGQPYSRCHVLNSDVE